MSVRVYRFRNEPPNTVIRALLEWAAGRNVHLLLVVRDELEFNERARALRERLEPDLVSSTKSSEWPGTQLLAHEALLLRYRLSEDVIDVVGSQPEGLFHWLAPDLPEDLAIVRSDGSALLTSIGHETEAWLSMNSDEHESLIREAPLLATVIEIPFEADAAARAICWTDAVLDAIRWERPGPDLSLDLSLDGTNALLGTDRVTLRATWVRDLAIEMTPNAFRAMTFEATFERRADGWNVVFDFGDGVIRFACNELFVAARG